MGIVFPTFFVCNTNKYTRQIENLHLRDAITLWLHVTVLFINSMLW